MCGTSFTLFFIKTGDRGGAGGTNSHQQTVENEGRTCGHPTPNNAHQVGGVWCGEPVNQSGAVGSCSWVAMAKKTPFLKISGLNCSSRSQRSKTITPSQ